MNKTPTVEFVCRRAPWSNGIELAVIATSEDGNITVADRPTFTVKEEGAYVTPTFKIKNDEAQNLMDELWRCGLRPTEGAGSAGSLAATERHLKDMQAIAMGLLRKDGVQV